MRLEFCGALLYWRGPSPYHFVRVPDDESAALRSAAGHVTYGWGMIPVLMRLGETRWETSLWPKDGGYYVPIKDFVREAEGIGLARTEHMFFEGDRIAAIGPSAEVLASYPTAEKIDGSGNVTLFANVAYQGAPNTGPALLQSRPWRRDRWPWPRGSP